ncbi:MAG: hypothetical protein R3F60_14920 [bacterium]
MKPETILITGACGYVGRLVVAELARTRRDGEVLIAADVVTPSAPTAGVEHLVVDVRDPGLPSLMVARGVTVVIHLAAIVAPGRGPRARPSPTPSTWRGRATSWRAASPAGRARS